MSRIGRVIFLLLLLLVLLVGCKNETRNPKESAKENITVEKEEKEEKQEQVETITDIRKPITEESPSKESEQIKETETIISQAPAPFDREEQKTEKPKKDTVKPPQKIVVSYQPETVKDLATEKVKARGKILLTDHLDRLLAEGSITKEEYDAYYPYDGAGYYSIFVETDLNEAKTTSGRRLESMEGIATYIAESLALEPGSYFLIEYVGVYHLDGTDFYEFRCYRA